MTGRRDLERNMASEPPSKRTTPPATSARDPPATPARDPPATLRAAIAPDPRRFAVAAVVAGLAVTVVAAAAGLARILPTLLDPHVPARAARPFVAGVIALALEVGALVGWPLGWTEVAIRSRERGEARARMALGEAPGRRLARMWPAMLVLAAVTAAGSLAWGRAARFPGRVARALLFEARESCAAADAPRVVAVPLVHASWLCRPGRAPLLVGEGPGSAAAIDFAAASLDIADDLTAFEAHDAQVLVATTASTRLSLGAVRIVGLHPFNPPSSIPPAARASAIVAAALASALLAAASALRGEAPARAVAWGVALVGPAATLFVMRACEHAGVGDFRWVAIPAAAVAATLLARGVAREGMGAARWLFRTIARRE